MKFIHTADWHLGKLLKEHAMTEDQEWLLMHRFLPLVDEERPDVILLSGDVYDRSYPPEEAVELFDRMTEEIVGKRHTPLIVISGNHDSAERLAVASRLLSHQGLYISARWIVCIPSSWRMHGGRWLLCRSPMRSRRACAS